jgi:hypothetical protein
MASFTHYSVQNYLQAPILAGTVEPVLSEHSFLLQLRANLKIKVLFLNDEEIVFDLIGVDAAIANALRRILIAEVSYRGLMLRYLIILC